MLMSRRAVIPLTMAKAIIDERKRLRDFDFMTKMAYMGGNKLALRVHEECVGHLSVTRGRHVLCLQDMKQWEGTAYNGPNLHAPTLTSSFFFGS